MSGDIIQIIKCHPIPTASSGMNITVPDSKQLTDLTRAIQKYILEGLPDEKELTVHGHENCPECNRVGYNQYREEAINNLFPLEQTNE